MDLVLRRRHLLTWMLLGPLLVISLTAVILFFADQPEHTSLTAPLAPAGSTP